MSRYRIRRIEDDAYIFSMARGFPGKIIASRTRKNRGCYGKNIFDFLKISKSEYDFFNTELCSGGRNSVVLPCGKGGLVFMLRFFAYGASLILAIVPEFTVDDYAALYRKGEFPDVTVSSALADSMNRASSLSEEEGERLCEYMGRVFGYAQVLEALCTPDFRPTVADVRVAADATGALVGVDIDTEAVYTAEKQDLNDNGIFVGELFVSVMLASAMIARESSIDRVLRVEIFCDGREVFLRYSFDRRDGVKRLDELSALSMIVKGHREIYFDIGEESETTWLEMWPYYYDVGAAEVKRPAPFVIFKLHRASREKNRKTNNS